jgi:hypothetical protein
MWLLVDDKRSLDSSEVDIIARNSQAAMEILLGMGHRLTGLVLDYDLGEKENIGKGGRRSREITGYDVLMFAIVNEVLPLTVQIITDNPAGRERLHNGLIHDAKYVIKTVQSHGRTRITYVKPDKDEIVK